MNPSSLEPYEKAVKLEEEKADTHMWILGSYIFEAVSIAISNAFRKKGQKPHSYREKPYLLEAKEKNGEATHEEIVDKTKAVFNMLKIMQANYELSKKSADNLTQTSPENRIKS